METGEEAGKDLERLEKELIRTLLDYKELKHTQYVGKDKLVYQHLAEVILEHKIFGLTLDRVDADAYSAFESMCMSLFQRPEHLHYSSYIIAKNALETI